VTIIALGVIVCLSAGQFDLSLASNASLAIFLCIGMYTRNGWPLPLCILLTLAIGALIGLVNGLLITRLRINAFIATLGTGGALVGVLAVYSDGQVISPATDGRPLPSWFASTVGSFQHKLSTPSQLVVVFLLVGCLALSVNHRALRPDLPRRTRFAILGAVGAAAVALLYVSGVAEQLSGNMAVLIVVATLLWIMKTFSSFGRSLFAIGANPRAAVFAGINVQRFTIFAFMIAGVLAALGGVIFAAMQGVAVRGTADGTLLPAYAAAFLSTVLVSRGRFHVWGTLFGSLCLTYVASGLVVGGVVYTWTGVINGVVLIGAVALSSTMRRTSSSV
jgi:ribose/xylose/arabinose/galactoside ABC-type transport system permease subunit